MQVPPFWQGLDRQSSMSAGDTPGAAGVRGPPRHHLHPPAHRPLHSEQGGGTEQDLDPQPHSLCARGGDAQGPILPWHRGVPAWGCSGHSPISQFSPVKPGTQLQPQTVPLAREVPPCRQGLVWQGSAGSVGGQEP